MLEFISLVYIIIGLNVVVSLFGFQNPEFLERYSFSVEGILKHGQWDRMLVSPFLHVSMGHLFFNMLSFYFFGEDIERVVGIRFLIFLYVGSAVGGDLLALFIHRKHPAYRAVGASGAIAGVIFASIFLFEGGRILVFPIPFPVPTWVYAIFFVLISVFGIGRQSDNIGHEAHLGGALTGILISLLVYPGIVLGQPILLVAVTLPVVGFLIFYLLNPDFFHNRYNRNRRF